MINVHRRFIAASPAEVWSVLARLGGAGDTLYPAEWGKISVPEGISVGAPILHRGMICEVETAEPGRRLWIRLPGRLGGHGFDLIKSPGGTTVTHTASLDQHGRDRLRWPLVVRPLHDATIEALLDNLQRASTGQAVRAARVHPYARSLRRVLARKAAPPPPPVLDSLLPRYDFSSRYTRRIEASQDAVWDAMCRLTADELPVTRVLMGIRTGGKARRTGPLLERATIPTLVRDEGRELVSGTVAQFWKARPAKAPIPPGDPDAFTAFRDPGWAKAAMSVHLTAAGEGTLLSAETRVQTTDRASRRTFGLYWLLIRTFSGFIRREMLWAVARRAEARR